MAIAKVGKVQSQAYLANTRNGHGFVVTGSQGVPLFSVTYTDEKQADRARELLVQALENAAEVMGYGS